MSFKHLMSDMSPRELITYHNSILEPLFNVYYSIDPSIDDDYYCRLQDNIDFHVGEINKLCEDIYHTYMESVRNYQEFDAELDEPEFDPEFNEPEFDPDWPDFIIANHLNIKVQHELLRVIKDRKDLQKLKRQAFNTFHNDLIAAAMSPNRIMKQINMYNDFESFFNNV